MAPEHIARREQQEEDRLETGRAARGEPQGRSAGSQHAQHGDALCVHSAGVELAEHRHEEQRQESGDDPRSIPGVCLVERGAGGDEQRPQKGDGSEERRDRNCDTS